MTETIDTTLAPDAPVVTDDPAAAAAVSQLLEDATAAADAGIRPFSYHATDEELADMRRRIEAVRWPDREVVDDQSQGVQLATIQALAQYWLNDYDWRRCEARINAFPNFITEIDGLDIHFIHVRSRHENALPMIVTHGWPGSVVEQLKIVGPLTDPTAHGGTEADAFHLVIPSMPGYGFSGKPTATGWDGPRIARAWDVLMKRLGYQRYVAQGGDWGALITELLGVMAPEGLAAIHTNMPSTVPGDILTKAIAGAAEPDGLSAEESQAYGRLLVFFAKGLGYALEMGARPQTLYGLADSPVALAAWMIDHDLKSYEMIARSFAGVDEGLTRDDVLDNVTLFWLTNTGVSASRLYWENKFLVGIRLFQPFGVKVPIAVSAFPDEIYPVPRSWAEQTYGANLIHYNQLPKGGHFAAWEQPGFVVDELRTAFRSIR
jgi:pimeloyl-ACP methyl ester carboxylesterase